MKISTLLTAFMFGIALQLTLTPITKADPPAIPDSTGPRQLPDSPIIQIIVNWIR